MSDNGPVEIVDRQLAAYNARDLNGYCALFADDAVLLELGERDEIARGKTAIEAYYRARFATSPQLHCVLLNRIVLGNYVVDHERVSGIEANDVELVAVYEVWDRLIQSVRFLSPRRGAADIFKRPRRVEEGPLDA